MELLRVHNLLSHSVGVGNHVLHARVEGDPQRPGYRDLPAEEVTEWLENTANRPVLNGWVKVEPPSGEPVAKAKVKEEAPVVPTTTVAPTTTMAPAELNPPATEGEDGKSDETPAATTETEAPAGKKPNTKKK